MRPCVFCDIVAARSPASVAYRDEQCVAFMDTRPINPGHLLVVPTAHAASLSELPSASGGALFAVAQRLAAAVRRSGLRAEGVNVFLADGEAAGQQVFHLHLHVLPRFRGDGFGLRLPPHYGGEVDRERLDAHAEAVARAVRSA